MNAKDARRLTAKFHVGDGCWPWTAYRDRDGYGDFHFEGKVRSAHRVVYEWLIGPIPDGLQLDHLCRNPSCVNPGHLEPVDNRTNVLRGVGLTAIQSRQTHCLNGHEFTPENTYRKPAHPRQRICRTCHRDNERRRREA